MKVLRQIIVTTEFDPTQINEESLDDVLSLLSYKLNNWETAADINKAIRKEIEDYEGGASKEILRLYDILDDGDVDDLDSITYENLQADLDNIYITSGQGYGTHMLQYTPLSSELISTIQDPKVIALLRITNDSICIYVASKDNRYIHDFNIELSFNPNTDPERTAVLCKLLKAALDKPNLAKEESRCQNWWRWLARICNKEHTE